MNCWWYVEKHLNGLQSGALDDMWKHLNGLQTGALDDMWKNTWIGYKVGGGTWWYVEKHLNGLQTGALDDMWKNTWIGYKVGGTWWYVGKHMNGLQTGTLDDMWKNTWIGYKLGHLMICGKTLEWVTNWGTWWYVEIHLNGLQTGALEACLLIKMCRTQCINFFNIPYISIYFLKKTVHRTISSLNVILKFLKCRINKQKCEIWQGKLMFFSFLFKKNSSQRY